MIDAKDYKGLERLPQSTLLYWYFQCDRTRCREKFAVRKLEKDTTELNFVPKSLSKDFGNRKVISNVNSIVNFPSGIKSQPGIFVHGIGGKECFPKADIREIHKIFLDKGFFA